MSGSRTTNGSTDFIDPGNVCGITGAITVQAWINVAAFQTASINQYAGIVEKGTTGSVYYNLALSPANATASINLPTWEVQDNTGTYHTIKGSALTTGGWHHLLGTWDGATTLTLYVDGVSAGTASMSNPIQSGTGHVNIGRDQYSSGDSLRYLNASISEVCIWNVASSSTDASNLASQLAGTVNPTGIQGYWPLRGIQSPEPDISTSGGAGGGTANGNDGTLTGTTTGSKPPALTYQTSPVTITSSGTTFFLPQTTSVQVECVGGGQAGTTGGVTGGIGGKGGYDCNGVISGLTVDFAYKAVVGTGGATSAANGADTTFNATSVVAPGGNSGTSPVGTVQNAGGAGGASPTAGGGGGGGSGGTSSAGNAGSPDSGVSGGAGGVAVTGGGAGGAGGNTGANGTVGGVPGGGGGGGGAAGTQGAGASGKVVLTWPVSAFTWQQLVEPELTYRAPTRIIAY